MEPNFEFLGLTPNAGPAQTYAGCRWTPYDFIVHVDHVFLKDKVVFESILERGAQHKQGRDPSLDQAAVGCW